MIKAILILTTLWNGQPIGLTFRIETPSMAECEKLAAEFHRRGGDTVDAVCVEHKATAAALSAG
jgi:hypothetical protein